MQYLYGHPFEVNFNNDPSTSGLPIGRFMFFFLLNLYSNSPYFSCMLYALTFERVEEFQYLGTTLTYQNSIAEEIKSRLRSGNACYHSVQNRLFSRLLSKNLKIKIYRTIILPIVLYGCETWSLTPREEMEAEGV